ncbi:MAG: 5'-methylthioadenosine/adenosylhomocysteine nucleosidase [Bacilli bacterium]
MNCIGIITAMEVEALLIKKEMAELEMVEYAGVIYCKGMIRGKNVVLLTCGIGKVNAAIYTQILIDKFQVNTIIHTGIAGSMDDKVKHLSLVVGLDLTYYDVRKEQMINWFPKQSTFKSDASLVELLMKNAPKDTLQGLIVTGDDFISERSKKEKIKQNYQEALCIEMEGSAVAHTAFVNKVPFVVIRCISDLADNSADIDYESFERQAADKVGTVVLNTIYTVV